MAILELSPSHNLIGTRMELRADGSLCFVPTRHDFWQRISVALLFSFLGGALIGFMLLLESKASGPLPEARKNALVVLRGIQALGGLIILWAVLSVVAWFRKRMWMWIDRHGNLAFASRVWICRRETFPLANLRSIKYGVRQEAIGRIPVSETTRPKEPVATVWIWSVAIEVHRGQSGEKPRLEGFYVTAHEDEPRPGQVPNEVVTLCTWLREKTGKSVIVGNIT